MRCADFLLKSKSLQNFGNSKWSFWANLAILFNADVCRLQSQKSLMLMYIRRIVPTGQ